jgi:hypothetical protein
MYIQRFNRRLARLGNGPVSMRRLATLVRSVSSTRTYRPEPRSALQKHKRIISFVGALIVFFTFIIKEGGVEKLKEQTSSIDSAENIFALRSDNSRTQADVSSLKKMFEERLAPAVYSGMGSNASRDEAAFILTQQAVRDAIDRIRASTSNLNDFLRAVPHSRDLDKKLLMINNDVGVYERALERIKRERDVKPTTNSEAKRPPYREYAQDLAHAKELSSQVDLDGVLGGLRRRESEAASARDSALNQSKNYKEELEKKRQRYQVIAIVAYAVGWGFGLIVRLMGGSGLVGDES